MFSIDEIMALIVFFGISVVLGIISQIFVQNFFLTQINKDIGHKMQTFKAGLSRMGKSDRDPTMLETFSGLAQTFLLMKQEGYSVKDILKEFGFAAAEETAKAMVEPAKDT